MKQEITQELKQAFDTDLKDAIKEFTAIRHITRDDDWIINDNQGTQSTYTGRGVFSNYHVHEIDGQSITMHDIKLICLADELTDAPKIDDVMDGKRVLAVGADPAGVSFTIQLRGL